VIVSSPCRPLAHDLAFDAFFQSPLEAGVCAQGTASTGRLWSLFFFFLKAGAFVFGSGLAIVPFLYGGVVGR